MRAYIVLAIASIVAAVGYEFLSTRKWPTDWWQFVFRAARHGLMVFLILTFFQVSDGIDKIRSNVDKVRSNMIPQTDNALARAQQSLTEMGGASLFAKQAQPRVAGMRDRLERIASGEIDLDSPDDVTSTWLKMFGPDQVSNTVKATNVISPAFWQSAHNMGADAMAAHRNAIARGVRISRLYIVDDADPNNKEQTRHLAADYAKIHVANRFIALRKLEQLPNYGDCSTRLAAIDFVVYDESVVLLVTHSASREVLKGRLSRNRQAHVDVASQCFESWWHEASETLP